MFTVRYTLCSEPKSSGIGAIFCESRIFLGIVAVKSCTGGAIADGHQFKAI